MSEQVQIAIVSGFFTTLGLWIINHFSKVRDQEAKAEAQVVKAELAVHTETVKAVQDTVVAKVEKIQTVTDGVNSALVANARSAEATIHQLQLIIAGFGAQQALATEPTPLVVSTNGREHTEEPEPIPVYTQPGDSVAVAGSEDAPVPVPRGTARRTVGPDTRRARGLPLVGPGASDYPVTLADIVLRLEAMDAEVRRLTNLFQRVDVLEQCVHAGATAPLRGMRPPSGDEVWRQVAGDEPNAEVNT